MRTRWIGLVFLSFLTGVVAAPVPKDGPTPPVAPEHLKASRKNLAEIALAWHNHADVEDGLLPMDIVDEKGKPLLSWRVRILAYLGEEELLKQFKFTEPWDSAHNKKLVAKMPKVFAPIRVKAPLGMTFYQAFAGAGGLLDPKKHPAFPVTITDGLTNTAMVFEAGEPVIWTKPADLPFDAKKPLPKLGGMFDGEFHVARCDGTVILVKSLFDENEMKRLIMPADGGIVDFDKLTK